MSVNVMSWVWDSGPKRQADRFVLLAIADNANDQGEAWPSIALLCRKTCMSERGVQTIIRRLQAEGWLCIETGKGRRNCNLYTIKNPAGNAPARAAPPHMDAETPHMDAKNPAPHAPEPSYNHQKEPSSLSPSAPKPKRKTRIPPDAVISEKQIQIAKDQGHTEAEARAQFERFKDGAIANGRAYVDWDAAWRNWFTSQYFKPITYAAKDARNGKPSFSTAFHAALDAAPIGASLIDRSRSDPFARR